MHSSKHNLDISLLLYILQNGKDNDVEISPAVALNSTLKINTL